MTASIVTHYLVEEIPQTYYFDRWEKSFLF